METLLEQQRRYHEERERLTDAMVKEMLHPKKTVNLQKYGDGRLPDQLRSGRFSGIHQSSRDMVFKILKTVVN